MEPVAFPHLKYAALTDIGRLRRRNEDAILVVPEFAVFGVCDGLGGAEGGAEASQIVVQTVEEALRRPTLPAAMRSHAFRVLTVVKALGEAGQRIRVHAARRRYRGMGSTATFLMFSEAPAQRATLLHVGDTLAFRLRGANIERLFEPHCVEVEYGQHAAGLPLHLRTLLTRAIGIREHEQLEPTPVDVKVGDIFLVASDGLTNMVPPGGIAARLATARTRGPAEAARALVEAANDAGGRDNISVIVVVVGPPTESQPATTG